MIDPFAILLFGCFVVVSTIDFFLSKSTKRRIQDRIATIALRFDDIRLGRLGIAEAAFCQRIMRWAFGTRLICWRRIDGCAIFYIAGLVVAYLAIELGHYLHGYPLEPPFSANHFGTGFPLQLPTLMISTFTTQKLLDYSIVLADRYKIFSVAMFIAIPFSFYISNFVYVLFGEILYLFFSNMVFHGWRSDTPRFIVNYFNSRILTDLFNPNFWTYVILHPFFIDPRVVRDPLDLYTAIYNEAVRVSALLIRPLLSIVFIVSFLVIRPGHKLLSILLYRFAEAESGVLAVFAGIMAGTIKLIQMAVKSSTGH